MVMVVVVVVVMVELVVIVAKQLVDGVVEEVPLMA